MPHGRGCERDVYKRQLLYNHLILTEKLYPHLWEIQETATARMEQMICLLYTSKSHWSAVAIGMTCLQASPLQRRMAQVPAENTRITTFRARL